MTNLVINKFRCNWDVFEMAVPKDMTKEYEALKSLIAVDSNVVVAGGYIRDAILGRTPNDIDVFISCHERETFGSFERRLKHAGWHVNQQNIKWGDNIPLDYKLNPNIRFVVNVEREGLPYPVQLIVLFKPDYRLVDRFPVSISQAFWNVGADCFRVTKAFNWTLDKKVITLENPLYADGHSYLSKIEEKFSPEYSCFWRRLDEK